MILFRLVETLAAERLVHILFAEHHQFVAEGEPVGEIGEISAFHTDGVNFLHVFSYREQSGHRAERLSEIIHVQTCYYHAHSAVGELLHHFDKALIEELRLIDSYDLHVVGNVQNFSRGADRGARNAVAVVRNHVAVGIAVVDLRLENLDFLVCELRSFEPSYEFFGLS